MLDITETFLFDLKNDSKTYLSELIFKRDLSVFSVSNLNTLLEHYGEFSDGQYVPVHWDNNEYLQYVHTPAAQEYKLESDVCYASPLVLAKLENVSLLPRTPYWMNQYEYALSDASVEDSFPLLESKILYNQFHNLPNALGQSFDIYVQAIPYSLTSVTGEQEQYWFRLARLLFDDSNGDQGVELEPEDLLL